jgi:aspartyl-tRNA(Asn)/glutamyl-tRNA(Gln) amidotransferase subunit C
LDGDASRIALVRRTAALARLSLDATEEAALAAEFGRILEHFRVLEEVDVEGVEPMTSLASMRDVTRPDEPRSIEIDRPLLQAAPASREGFYVVPKTVGGER